MKKGEIYLLRNAKITEVNLTNWVWWFLGKTLPFIFDIKVMGSYNLYTKNIKIFLPAFTDYNTIPNVIQHEYLHKLIHEAIRDCNDERIISKIEVGGK